MTTKAQVSAATAAGDTTKTIIDTLTVPASVKRAVWLRDGGRCAFVANNGRRCAARGFLGPKKCSSHQTTEKYATAHDAGKRPGLDRLSRKPRAAG